MDSAGLDWGRLGSTLLGSARLAQPSWIRLVSAGLVPARLVLAALGWARLGLALLSWAGLS